VPPVSRAFDFSGFSVRLHGLDEPCAAVLDDAWGLFAGDGGDPVLELEVNFEGAELPAGIIDPAPLDRTIRGKAIGWVSREGRVEVDEHGRGKAVVGTGNDSTRAWGLVNLILPVLAWRLPSLGLFLVHSGAVIVRDRAFVLVGRSGAGKSTFVEQAAAGGAVAAGEDLNLLLYEGNRWWLAGSPLRNRLGPGPGRWPLAALLTPDRGATPALEPASRLLVSAQLQANLPYIGDCLGAVDGGAALVESLDQVPALRLTFAPDPAFVPLLEAWPD
jgi:hypothetical protein